MMEGQERQCVWCDRIWAGIGFMFGAVVILVSLDLMLNGRLSSIAAQAATQTPELGEDE